MATNILIEGKDNNLNFLRFIAATMVIVSHAFPITMGVHVYDPLYYTSNGQETWGTIAVKIFFIVSGFLILMSWDRKKRLLPFLKARMLRIFPALILIIVVSAFIMGPIFTSCSLKEYFTNSETYRFLMTITLRKQSNLLPGVFVNNTYPNSINSSLWTLFYEFACYLMIAFLGCTKLLKKPMVWGIFIFCYFCSAFDMYAGPFISLADRFSIQPAYMLTTYFVAGMIVYLYRDKIKLNLIPCIIAMILLVLSVFTNSMKIVMPFALTYVVFYFSFNKKIKLSSFGTKNDLSYGLYIYAFPIQQIISNLSNGTEPWYINFLIAFPFTALFAYLSWNLVEKRCLKLKSKKHFVADKAAA